MSMDPLSDEAFFQADDLRKNEVAADRQLSVEFFTDEIKDEKASAEAGRPIYQSVEMCRIRYGDRGNVVVDRVKYMDPDPRKRFPVQWARFKAGEQRQVVGTLLREWGLLDRATSRGYEDIGILTVEQLAGLSDGNAQQIRGSLADRQRARDFLAMAEGQAPVAQARAENAALRAELAALREMVQGITGATPAVAEATPKRRGRPPGSKNRPKDPAPEPSEG